MYTDTGSAATCRPRLKDPSVSPQLQGNIALKALQPFDEKKLNDHQIFRFLQTYVLFGLAALTAFNRNAKSVTGGPCRYNDVKGVLL